VPVLPLQDVHGHAANPATPLPVLSPRLHAGAPVSQFSKKNPKLRRLGAGTGPLSPFRGRSRLPKEPTLPCLRAGAQLPTLFRFRDLLPGVHGRYFFSGLSHRSLFFLLRALTLAFVPVSSDSLLPTLRVLPPLFLPPSTHSPPLLHAHTLPPSPAGTITNLAIRFDDGATIKLSDPTATQGSLSRIDAQPWRLAAHDVVLGYWDFIPSRLACWCQSGQQFRGIWLYHDSYVCFPSLPPPPPPLSVLEIHGQFLCSRLDPLAPQM
jgi:hypothetical protein